MQKMAVCGATKDIPGTVAGNVECNEACRVFERNRRLANALDMDETKAELSGQIISPELDYSESLVKFAFANRRYVLSLEKMLDEFIHGEAKVLILILTYIIVLLLSRPSWKVSKGFHHAFSINSLRSGDADSRSEYKETIAPFA
jgi:hypothetical protein